MPTTAMMFRNVSAGGGGGFYRTVTIDHTKVGSSDQTDFPVLVSGTYSYLATLANGGKVQNASGFDIGFYSDAALTTKLKWETEKYVAATGQVIYWVKVPTVSHTADTVIYVGYGNTSITTDQSDTTNVWDSHFQCVYHYPDGSSLAALDSTANGFNGTITSATAATGQIDGSAHFNGTSAHIANTSMVLTAARDITVSFWNKVATGDGGGSAFNIGAVNDPNRCQAHVPWSDNNIYWDYGNSAGTGRISASYAGNYDAWTYVTLVARGNGTLKEIRLNGAVAATSGTSGAPAISLGTLQVGWFHNPSGIDTWHKGDIDEFRISDSIRSSDWTLAEYNNQSSPSTFYTLT